MVVLMVGLLIFFTSPTATHALAQAARARARLAQGFWPALG